MRFSGTQLREPFLHSSPPVADRPAPHTAQAFFRLSPFWHSQHSATAVLGRPLGHDYASLLSIESHHLRAIRSSLVETAAREQRLETTPCQLMHRLHSIPMGPWGWQHTGVHVRQAYPDISRSSHCKPCRRLRRSKDSLLEGRSFVGRPRAPPQTLEISLTTPNLRLRRRPSLCRDNTNVTFYLLVTVQISRETQNKPEPNRMPCRSPRTWQCHLPPASHNPDRLPSRLDSTPSSACLTSRLSSVLCSGWLAQTYQCSSTLLPHTFSALVLPAVPACLCLRGLPYYCCY